MEKVTGTTEDVVMEEAPQEEVGDFFYRQKADGSIETYLGLAEGAILRRDDFLSSTWENDPQWKEGIPGGAKEKIRKAVKYYERDPAVSKSVKLLAQLSNDSLKIASEDKSVEDFFNEWWEDLGGTDFLSYFFLEFFRSGNVPIFKTLIPYKPQNYDPKKPPATKAEKNSWKIANIHAKAEAEYYEAYDEWSKGKWHHSRGNISHQKLSYLEKTYHAKKYVWSKKMIPGAYTILNPLSIEIKGPEGVPWARRMYLEVESDVSKIIKNPPKEIADVIKTIPRDILTAIKGGEDEIFLPDYLCEMVTRDKQPYETWAVPLTTHAFEALDYKYQLRDMDKATVKSVRNRILKVTVGNDQYPCFDPKVIKQLSKEFNNPSRTLTLFWNHTLAVEFVEPNLESLNKDKYEPVDEDIRTCFGIAKVLTGNSGEAIGNNVLNLKGLVEILSEAQDAFLSWFNKELKRIAEAVNLGAVPEAKFGKLNLKDENEFIKVLSALVDRQIISYETMVETIGYHFPREVERLKKEEKLRQDENILVPQKAPTQQSGDEGRPSGVTEDNPRKDREGKTRDGNGLKLVSSFVDPMKFETYKGEISELFAESKKNAELLAKANNSENNDEMSLKTWSSVLTFAVERYNMDEDPESLTLFCVLKSKEIHKANQEKSFDDIMISVAAMRIAQQ